MFDLCHITKEERYEQFEARVRINEIQLIRIKHIRIKNRKNYFFKNLFRCKNFHKTHDFYAGLGWRQVFSFS